MLHIRDDMIENVMKKKISKLSGIQGCGIIQCEETTKFRLPNYWPGLPQDVNRVNLFF